MTRLRLGDGTCSRPWPVRAIALAWFFALLTVRIAAAQASADPAAVLPESDRKCLACHQTAGFQMQLPDGETMPLQISGDAFAHSVHSMLGCAGCHSDIDPAKHPADGIKIGSRRSFSLERVQVCAGCHSDKFDQWKGSVHAALVRAGNPIAPICTSCHNPHAVIKGVAEAMNTVPCKACHGAIFTAYAASVHGTLRGSGITQAPLCFSCHGAHDVKVPTAGAGLKSVCFGCHTKAVEQHQAWLPNTLLHFDVVSCPACHAPKAHREVDLVLYNSTNRKEAARPVGVPEFESPGGASAGRTGLDAAALFNLLKALNRPGAANKTSIKGRLDVETGVEAHQLAPASEAISDCDTCHRAGAAAFQRVTISVAGPGGVPIHYGVNKNVLNSAFSIASIGGFYAIGGTRITFLDVLLVLALLGGFGIPALHLTVRWLSKRPTHHDQPKG